MSALAPDPAGVLHPAARQPAPRQRQHPWRPTGRLAAAAAIRPGPHRQAAVPAGPGRPRRAVRGRLPGPPGARTRQQRAHPECPAGRHPLLLPLRGAVSPRTRRADRPGARHPRQESRTQRAVLPQQARGRRPCWPTPDRDTWTGSREPRPAGRGHRHRPAGLRADRPAQPRCRARRRRSPQLRREGPQTQVHAAAQADRRSTRGPG